jgi:hypothetical protein
MPELSFSVEGAEPVPYAASPMLALKLRLANVTDEPIHTIALNCQVQLDVTRRRYNHKEQKNLRDLFDEPSRWGQTLKAMLWANTSVVVPSFTGSAKVDLPISCTFDFNVAATKYFAGLDNGEVPLCLLFSGTIFYEAEDGALQIAKIPWDKEVNYRMPVEVWQEMMDIYYPNSAWLCLQRDVFDRLYQFKVRNGIPTWERTLERILSAVE